MLLLVGACELIHMYGGHTLSNFIVPHATPWQAQHVRSESFIKVFISLSEWRCVVLIFCVVGNSYYVVGGAARMGQNRVALYVCWRSQRQWRRHFERQVLLIQWKLDHKIAWKTTQLNWRTGIWNKVFCRVQASMQTDVPYSRPAYIVINIQMQIWRKQ